MAKYDLPGIVDFIVNKTGQEKMHFIGHSLGTTIGMSARVRVVSLAGVLFIGTDNCCLECP